MPTELPTSPARAHAETARELLAGLERANAQIAALTPEQHLEYVAAGGVSRTNKDMQWTAELAATQALTSIALSLATCVELFEKRLADEPKP